ncbi:MAG: transposase [Rhabdochlamydiaceae bacterium]
MTTKKTNPNYIIPTPLKEVIGSVSSCLYDSPYCDYSRTDIATAIVASAIQNRSQNGVAKSPDSDTVFWRIYNELTIDALRLLIGTQRPPKGAHIIILLDGHDKMFYGKDALGLVGTKPKAGSSDAFKYLVAFSNGSPKGIIDVREMFDGSAANGAIELVQELQKDYVIDWVIMDGEFYKAEFIDYLTAAKIPFITKRTNTENIRELGIEYGKPYFYKTDVERSDGKIIHLEYWIYRYRGKGGDFFLVSNMKNGSETIRKLFKSRWNIETGFREVNRVGIKTTTRDFLVRLFFYIVSCMVYNLWQKIQFRYSTAAIRFDDVIDFVKRYLKQLVLSASDIFAIWRRRCIRLRII